MTAPPRKVAGGCRGSGRTAGGGDCRLLEMPDGCWETPGTTGAGSARAPRRWGGAVPSSRTPLPHRRGGVREVHPPSGPAGLRNDGCRDTEGYGKQGISFNLNKTHINVDME